jgi:hypothetical protein
MKSIKQFILESFRDLDKAYMALDDLPAIMLDVLQNSVDRSPENMVDMAVAMSTGQVPSPGSDDDITEKDYADLCGLMKKIEDAWKVNKSALKAIEDPDNDLTGAKLDSNMSVEKLLDLISDFHTKLNKVYGSKVTEGYYDMVADAVGVSAKDMVYLDKVAIIAFNAFDKSILDMVISGVTEILTAAYGLDGKSDDVKKEVTKAFKTIPSIAMALNMLKFSSEPKQIEKRKELTTKLYKACADLIKAVKALP